VRTSSSGRLGRGVRVFSTRLLKTRCQVFDTLDAIGDVVPRRR